jgi:hypothetical protein
MSITLVKLAVPPILHTDIDALKINIDSKIILHDSKHSRMLFRED